MDSFDQWMKDRQAEWRMTHVASQERGEWGDRPYAHILPKDLWEKGLWPGIGRESENSLPAYLQRTGVPNTTVALLMPAGITAVGSGIFGLWPGASVSIATSQAQNQRNSLASIPGG